MKDWYSILGVLPSIEPEALRPIYLALIKKYHPDVFKGDLSFSEAKTKDLNEAYRILSDPNLRRDFDEELSRRGVHKKDFTDENTSSEDPIDLNELEENWLFVTNYHPELLIISSYLGKISQTLNADFKIRILTTKDFKSATVIANVMKTQHLNRYFGKNPQILDFAETAILCFRRDIALELNKAITVLGEPGGDSDTKKLLENISLRFNWSAENEKGRPPKEKIVFSQKWLSDLLDLYESGRIGFFTLYCEMDQSTFIQFGSFDGAMVSIIANKVGNPLSKLQSDEFLAIGFEEWDTTPDVTRFEFGTHVALVPFDKSKAAKVIVAASEILGVSEGTTIVAEVDDESQNEPILPHQAKRARKSGATSFWMLWIIFIALCAVLVKKFS